ncbi:hypothetical protein SAMN05444156_3180 [Verrucomicrobium sp. GAS474]|uniref:hypothetical protein n=1 Tax=Verrucomicrobium sp. GAS474 TaxID=1882831 RepID=UPI00087B02A0|nr:hypothetical protein [Verrucomicrobium sp. GAS474]SDU30424.1 hypothetical protein SAMN05444156_3180 [Verrucomicrobium sp. GAS474]
MRRIFLSVSLLGLALAFSTLAPTAHAGLFSSSKTPTAFEALDVAKKQVTPEIGSKLISITGERSETALTPDTWKFNFYDELASQHGRQITTKGKAVAGVRDGYTQLDKFRLFAYKLEEVVGPDQLKIDSDKALKIVQKTNLLNNYSLSSVLYTLARDSDLREPVWKIQIFIDGGDGKEKDAGYARISAFDGKVLELRFKTLETAKPEAK